MQLWLLSEHRRAAHLTDFMPRWIIYNSPDDCPASEQKVAEFLQGLDDSFTVRWGFFFTDPYSNLSREGE